jgi:hypothetical protein
LAQHQKDGVKQMSPGLCGGTCALAELRMAPLNARASSRTLVENQFMRISRSATAVAISVIRECVTGKRAA